MIWHPHLWRETAYIRPFSPSRGMLQLPRGRLDFSHMDGYQAVVGAADLLAGGVWRSDPEKHPISAISCERCCWCGAERVSVERYFAADIVLTPEQACEWLDIVQRRYDGMRYNGMLYAYGMPVDAIHKRADPSGKNARHHVVYTGPQ